jgi:hypothetical protein
MKRNLRLAAAVLANATWLCGGVVFSTLAGPQTGGYQVVGASNAIYTPESVAASFESDWPFLFTGAQVQVFAIQGATFNMTLFSSDANGLPGVPLASAGTGLTAPAASGVVAAVSPVTLTLAAQTQYWLVLTPASSDTQVSWGVVNGVATSAVSTTMQTNGAGGWAIVGYEPVEFQIDGVVETPEPGTIALAAMALGALLLLKLRE